jgi:acyl-CoA synthetase (AMP-forming)/AMP-acid ligase II
MGHVTALEWVRRTTPADLRETYLREKWWSGETLGELLIEHLGDRGELAFVTRSQVHPWSGTFADVLDQARRLAGGLRRRGIKPGDVVAFQLPNWVEAAATFYATAMLGAVVAPVVHFYGPKELGHILRESGAKAFVTTRTFGSLDLWGSFESVRDGLSSLDTVAVVGEASYDELLADDPVDEPASVDPDWPALVAYTSGTTSAPKGVVHTHHSIVAEIKQLSAVQPDDEIGALPTLVGAPVGHGIGMLAALLLPVYKGVPVHLIDVWDPAAVLAAMLADNLVSGTGATYFLTSLLDHPDLTREHLDRMRHIGLGGSAVPAAVTERATSLGLSVVRLYGSTEHPSITGCTHADPLDKRLHTDGRPLPGIDMRLADDGEIESRGPDLFAGYVDPQQTAAVFTADGWYRTEDVGVVDEDGYLAITDRKKDIIIRGGENISAAEVEELVLRMPGVAEVAVVAAPDARLGEHAAAFVRSLPGAEPPSLDAVKAALADAGLTRQKWPEELHVVADFPRTASGKIRKVDLRTQLRAASPA